MSIIRALAASALIALTACSQPAPQQQASTTPSATTNGKPGESAPPPASEPQSSGKPDAPSVATQANRITPAFLIGRWGDNGDCSKDVVFNPDSTFHSYTGGGGNWRINGDTIIMSGATGTFSMQMQYIDQNHLMLRNPDGSVGTSQRC